MINPTSENFTLVSTTKDTLFNLLKNFKVTIGQQFSKNWSNFKEIFIKNGL